MKIPHPAAEREQFTIPLQPDVDSPILAVGSLSGVPACVRTSAVPSETRRSDPLLFLQVMHRRTTGVTWNDEPGCGRGIRQRPPFVPVARVNSGTNMARTAKLQPRKHLSSRHFVVETMGIEPTTPCLQSRRPARSQPGDIGFELVKPFSGGPR